ncbi:MAG: ADP-ribosylglycohydrolase family protein [Halobacteriota archaeon]|nr:ADP-ribosylglycohydrolase family protein [Halobacteriota archaeon]
MAQIDTKCLIGLAIGDALGEPFEGLHATQIEKVWKGDGFFKDPEITDDTILTIIVAESILEQRGVSGESIGRKIISNEDKLRRIGPTTSNAIYMLKEDIKFKSKTGTTNGAAMRASPVGLACDKNIIEETVEASQVTHGTDVAISGACCISSAINSAINASDKDEVIEECIKGAMEGRRSGVPTNLPKIDDMIELALDTPIRMLSEVIGVGIQTHESVPCAVALFYSSNDFKDAVVNAVKLGGDTDTIASMSGAISGAFYGEVPSSWALSIKEVGYLDKLEKGLLKLKFSSV